jgi:RNA polymerase sigma-54 factor
MRPELSQNVSNKQFATQKQQQILMMHPVMQQALTLLQAPILELEMYISQQMEQNPLLEMDEHHNNEEEPKEFNEDEIQEVKIGENDFSTLERMDESYNDHFDQDTCSLPGTKEDTERKHLFLENSLRNETSLFQYLMRQAEEIFEDPNDLKIATEIIGDLNEWGYLETPTTEIATRLQVDIQDVERALNRIQSFDPTGVGARDIRECLLLQLRARKQNNGLGYQIIENHYDDLLHNRMPKIEKALGLTQEMIQKVIKEEISVLDIHPGLTVGDIKPQYIIPDASVYEESGELVIKINEEGIPTIRLNNDYLKMLHNDSVSTDMRRYIKQNAFSARWLMRNIEQRKETLTKIISLICHKQKEFLLNPKGQLEPMIMKEIAEELSFNESTIARAVGGKYLQTPRGVYALKSFFTNSYTTSGGESLSSQTVKEALKRIINKEDKQHPLSDEAISSNLKKEGIPCARRTVSKYRRELQIGSASQRKKFTTKA